MDDMRIGPRGSGAAAAREGRRLDRGYARQRLVSALRRVLGRGKAAVVAELLERQAADPATVTTSEHLEIPAGSTALSVAELKGHDDVAALLRR